MFTKENSLVILAGGLGSRYNGQKQIDGIGPNNESLMEYSIYDALKTGIKQFVFIVNSSFPIAIQNHFKQLIENQNAVCHFVEQNMNAFVPESFISQIKNRTKPWGTAHAVLVAKNIVKGNFIVINADDFYGFETYKKAQKLFESQEISDSSYGMIAFQVNNTLSENGSVSRGICSVKNVFLENVVEQTSIARKDKNIVYEEDNETLILDENTLVSMNFWVLNESVFSELETQFEDFLKEYSTHLKQEFYLPQAINTLVENKKVKVKLETSTEKWFGMTYAEDKQIVCNRILELIANQKYPNPLWK